MNHSLGRKRMGLPALLLAVCMLLTAMSGCGVAASSNAESYEELFEKDSILKVEITLPETDWESMMTNPEAEEYHAATVSVDGETLSDVGVRTKGNSSLSKNENGRYSLRVKFDKYEKGQSLLGLDELVLNDQFADPSYLREYLSYEALREIGSPAPLAAFANVYVNGQLYGFYLCVEAIDNSLLERNFDSDEGNLYKQDMGSSLVYEENSEYPKSELKIGDDTTKTGLKKMIETLNNMPEGEKGNIEDVLDVDSALKYIAANTVLGNYDSYNGSMLQNYYLYDQDGVFTVIPWDYNMSFGGFMGTSSSGQTIPIDEPVYGVSMEKTPMITKLLAVPEYKEAYYDTINQLLDYLDGFEERVAGLVDLIEPYVEADPTKFVTVEQFQKAVTYQENEETQESPGGQMMTPPAQMDGEPPSGITPPDRMDGTNQPQAMTPPEQENGGQRQGGMEPGQFDGAAPVGRPAGEAGGQGGRGGMMGGRGGGGMAAGTGNSIINFVRARVENIVKQLAGELPTTGNTTMNQGNRGEGGFPGGTRPEQEKAITVTLDGNQISFLQAPVLENGSTLVALREIFEAIGAEINWDEETQTVTASKDGVTITLVIGEETAYKNGEAINLSVPAKVMNGRTMVPVRFVSESLGLNVDWDEAARQVVITQS